MHPGMPSDDAGRAASRKAFTASGESKLRATYSPGTWLQPKVAGMTRGAPRSLTKTRLSAASQCSRQQESQGCCNGEAPEYVAVGLTRASPGGKARGGLLRGYGPGLQGGG